METYSAARIRLLRELGSAGWVLSSPYLKTPHATSPDGEVRFWFKSQAIWYSVGSAYRDEGRGHSTFLDMRGLGVQMLLDEADRIRRE